MPNAPKILVFAGSLRKDSFNKRLARIAAEAVTMAGGDATLIDLRDFPMPVYDGDLEQTDGIPAKAKDVKELMKVHDGFLIASPEYNSSVSGTLKNVIDWVSRPEPNEPRLAAFSGKVAAIISASPGALGGLRGLFHLRSILMNVGTFVIPQMKAISNASDAFDSDGRLNDDANKDAVNNIATNLVETAGKLKA